MASRANKAVPKRISYRGRIAFLAEPSAKTKLAVSLRSGRRFEATNDPYNVETIQACLFESLKNKTNAFRSGLQVAWKQSKRQNYRDSISNRMHVVRNKHEYASTRSPSLLPENSISFRGKVRSINHAEGYFIATLAVSGGRSVDLEFALDLATDAKLEENDYFLYKIESGGNDIRHHFEKCTLPTLDSTEQENIEEFMKDLE